MKEKQLWWNAFAAATAVSMGAWLPAEWLTATSADGERPEGEGLDNDGADPVPESHDVERPELRGHR